MIVLLFCYEGSCSYDVLHCASLHHPLFDKMIFPLVPLIFSRIIEIVLLAAMQIIYTAREITLL